MLLRDNRIKVNSTVHGSAEWREVTYENGEV